MYKQTKLFAQLSGYLLIGTLSVFGLMTMLGMGTIGRAAASAPQVVEAPSPGESVPSSMNYQGILRDGDGNLIANDEYDLTFRIYDKMAAGEMLYEQNKTGIIVRDGRFSTTLSKIPTTVFTKNKDRFIGVTVGSFAEMTPRERLAAVPYAIQSEDAFNGVPVGGVVDWWRPTPGWDIPDGFVVCDGTPINDLLSPINGVTTPNLIGQMVRGATPDGNEITAGGSPTQTVSFNNGSYLEETVKTSAAPNHTHEITGHTGPIATSGVEDTGAVNYFVRDNSGIPWSGANHLVAAGGPATQSGGEGNHYHSATGLESSPAGGHDHTVTLPGLTGTQIIDILPPHVNLLKICRTR